MIHNDLDLVIASIQNQLTGTIERIENRRVTAEEKFPNRTDLIKMMEYDRDLIIKSSRLIKELRHHLTEKEKERFSLYKAYLEKCREIENTKPVHVDFLNENLEQINIGGKFFTIRV